MTVLIIYLSNDIEHVAACQGQSTIPTHATHPFHRGHVYTNLAVAPLLITIKTPTTTPQRVGFALPRMTWQVHSLCSASHKRLNFGTNVPISRAVPDIDRYTQLYMSIYITVYISICTYICTYTNDVCLRT
jgi:hypothetical protein